MFIQIVQAETSDADELKAAFDHWLEHLAPDAIGWLGTTAGVTADNKFIALVRFTSVEDARANSNRPEQHNWWMETSKLFSGDVVFHDCTKTLKFLDGGSDDAGFVQVMQGPVSDVAKLETAQEQATEVMTEFRPEIIGSNIAIHPDRQHYTEAIYFTSEAAAREGEKKEPPQELKDLFDEDEMTPESMTFFDLTDPWLHSL
ncbi:hypothetical protein FB566_4127 [Stackebrandtia endophytica]|uniref:Antibiotic biosynthesis monooxygenase n=1 Tax=Stackebrandtia endophytica TaxID=1496996 RepID=A0A543B135_9ACTN|nr:hypothetical protein [Stackebrandtia endophytica]TQL78538.1 hypothetical protein FB566_4127 [Stackebrandtia endophytica]